LCALKRLDGRGGHAVYFLFGRTIEDCRIKQGTF
jgi:hypothetical protein